MAGALTSLACAKAVVSPDTARSPKPASVSYDAVLSRPSSNPNASAFLYWR